MTQDELFQKRIGELANMAYHKGIVMFTDFLTLNELHMVNSRNFHDLGVSLKTNGGYDFAERQITAFIPDALSFDWEFPITCLHLRVKSPKFAEKLSHRDYLGAILNLGLERFVLGDILVDQSGAYVFCLNRIADYLKENLCSVRHTPVICEEITSREALPKPTLSPVNGTVASCRLDCLIALAFKSSRSSIVPLIEGGQVFVNGRMITSNGYLPKEGDIISVRKMGRFLFDRVGNTTKKGRHQVFLYRYL